MARTPQPSGTYARITSRLYGSLALSRSPASAELTTELLRRVAGGLIDACEAVVTSEEPALRLEQTMAALADEGLAYEASTVDGAVVLARLDCRWSRLVGDSAEAVEQERRVLSALLGVDEAQIVRNGVKFVYRAFQTALQPRS